MPEEAVALEESQSSTPEPSSDLGESTPETSPESRPPQPKNGEQPKKGLSRYERTKRERAAFKAERDAFQRERQAFMQEREQAAKPKRDYTLKDLTEARAAWAKDADWDPEKKDLVDRADKEIQAIKAEQAAQQAASNRTVQMPVQGTPEHRAQWESAEQELAQADAEFMREGTRLDSKLREIMASQDGNIYRQHPRGIVAAYHRAKMELLEADTKGLQTELAKAQEELKRYRGYTSIGGGAPARLGTGGRVENVNDFARLSLKDQRKHLLSGANRNGVPWF